MADDGLFTIKKFMEFVAWTESWVSNGHFAVKKARVKLGTHLTSNDAVMCAYPNAKGIIEKDETEFETALRFEMLRVSFTRSPWRHADAALFLDESGHAAWFNADYCDALGIAVLFGPSAMFTAEDDKATPYYDAPTFDEASIVIMPMEVPVDWDQVARTVAAATSVDDATEGRLVDIPATATDGEVGLS